MGIYGNHSVKVPQADGFELMSQKHRQNHESPKAAAIFASPFNKEGMRGDLKSQISMLPGHAACAIGAIS